jgi:hypothetical protein
MKRTYWWNPETQQMEEITRQPVEWRIGGERYGSETLAEMRKQNVVPPSDFTNHWAKKANETERIHRLGNGDMSQLRRNETVRRQIAEAIRSPRRGRRG